MWSPVAATSPTPISTDSTRLMAPPPSTAPAVRSSHGGLTRSRGPEGRRLLGLEGLFRRPRPRRQLQIEERVPIVQVQVGHLFDPPQPVLKGVAMDEQGGRGGVVAAPALQVRRQRPHEI